MSASCVNLDQLRRHAVARSLFAPTTLPKALQQLGFVQADPLRAPARAQDLTLRHRVAGYRAGDLEARYASLDVEEDFFVNYGFVRPDVHHLMYPRTPRIVWSASRMKQAAEVLAFVRERGVVRPAEVDTHFDHGTVTKVIGWANLSVKDGVLTPDVGYVASAPKDKAFAAALDEELQRMTVFLGLPT